MVSLTLSGQNERISYFGVNLIPYSLSSYNYVTRAGYNLGVSNKGVLGIEIMYQKALNTFLALEIGTAINYQRLEYNFPQPRTIPSYPTVRSSFTSWDFPIGLKLHFSSAFINVGTLIVNDLKTSALFPSQSGLGLYFSIGRQINLKDWQFLTISAFFRGYRLVSFNSKSNDLNVQDIGLKLGYFFDYK